MKLKKSKKVHLKIFLCMFFLSFINLGLTFAAGEDNSSQLPSIRLQELLTGYLQNDLLLQKYTLTAEEKALSLSSVKINNGIDVQLSTGSISVRTDTKGNTSILASPSLIVDVPSINDGQISVSIPYEINSDADEKYSVTGGSLSVSAGIISGSSKLRKIEILEAERAYLEAKRDVTDRVLNAEKEFYESLKKLYSKAISIHSKKNDYYDDSLALRVLDTQGYSKTSAKYRQAFLKVASDRRDIQEQQRIFERETAIFAMKCGKVFDRSTTVHDGKVEKGERDESYDPIKAGETAYQAAMNFLPESIPAVKSERIFDYDEQFYSKIEKANWNKYISDLKNEADYDLTLKATAEYKINSSVSGSDDAGGKLTFAWDGLSVSAGAYVPTGNNIFTPDSFSNNYKNDNPYFSLSLSLDTNKWRTSKIDSQKKQISSELDNIAIKDAKDDYETDILSKVSTFHDIKWAQTSYAQEYDMYTKLTADMEKWLEQGIVTENDYLDAKNNMEKARLNILLNAIDLIIFNNEVKLLFHGEVKK